MKPSSLKCSLERGRRAHVTQPCRICCGKKPDHRASDGFGGREQTPPQALHPGPRRRRPLQVQRPGRLRAMLLSGTAGERSLRVARVPGALPAGLWGKTRDPWRGTNASSLAICRHPKATAATGVDLLKAETIAVACHEAWSLNCPVREIRYNRIRSAPTAYGPDRRLNLGARQLHVRNWHGPRHGRRD